MFDGKVLTVGASSRRGDGEIFLQWPAALVQL